MEIQCTALKSFFIDFIIIDLNIQPSEWIVNCCILFQDDGCDYYWIVEHFILPIKSASHMHMNVLSHAFLLHTFTTCRGPCLVVSPWITLKRYLMFFGVLFVTFQFYFYHFLSFWIQNNNQECSDLIDYTKFYTLVNIRYVNTLLLPLFWNKPR